MKRKKIKKIKRQDGIGSRQKIYIVLFVIFLIGIVIGSIYSGRISEDARLGLMEEINTMLTLNVQNLIKTNMNFIHTVLFSNLKYILLIFLISFIYAFVPITIIILIIKGFSYGFTASFLMANYGSYGIKLVVASYVPHTILYILLFLLYSSISIDFAMKKHELDGKKHLKKDRRRLILEFILASILVVAGVIVISIIEAYLSPVLMNYMKK